MSQPGVSDSRGMQQSGSQKSEINFPPGRPSVHNVEALCRNQKQRPLYSIKCLPSTGYELLARQAKIINRVEKGYKQCCKKNQDVLVCAEQKVERQTTFFPIIMFRVSGKLEFSHQLITGHIWTKKFILMDNLGPRNVD